MTGAAGNVSVPARNGRSATESTFVSRTVVVPSEKSIAVATPVVASLQRNASSAGATNDEKSIHESNKVFPANVNAWMSPRTASHCWLVAALALGAASCGFGHTIQRPDDLTLVENLGANRYIYRSMRLVHEPTRGPAAPALAVPPAGAHEIGLIEVTASYGGLGAAGLRKMESDFYPRLATIAGEMGGTHFLVVRSTRETSFGQWITSLTVDVLAVPSPR